MPVGFVVKGAYARAFPGGWYRCVTTIENGSITTGVNYVVDIAGAPSQGEVGYVGDNT